MDPLHAGVKRFRGDDEDELYDVDEAQHQARLSRYPTEFIAKGEDSIKLHFFTTTGSDLRAVDPVSPVFTHQVFKDGVYCGYEGLKVDLFIDLATWRCVKAEEKFVNVYKYHEGQPLELIKQQECVKPMFQQPSEETLEGFPGRIIWEREDGYILRLCESLNEDQTKALLSRCLSVSTFFIERASQVDLDDAKWKLLLLTQRANSGIERLVGFTSLYEFINPIRDTRIYRVCVMLVLPLFQRMRFGDLMLRTVYRLASEEQDIEEVTVEDPCEGFTKMRRRMELGSCKSRNLFFGWQLEVFEQSKPILPESLVKQYKAETKFTKEQLQFCFECAWLAKLQEKGEISEENPRKEKFRLSIKKRLSQQLVDLPDKDTYKDEYKKVLQEEYLKMLSDIQDALSAVVREEGSN